VSRATALIALGRPPQAASNLSTGSVSVTGPAAMLRHGRSQSPTSRGSGQRRWPPGDRGAVLVSACQIWRIPLVDSGATGTLLFGTTGPIAVSPAMTSQG
jgi:hypothetical protein